MPDDPNASPARHPERKPQAGHPQEGNHPEGNHPEGNHPEGNHPEGNPQGRFVWHDLISTDPAASAAFYAALFGWEIRDLPMPQGTYRMIQSRPEAEGGVGLGGIEAVPQDGVPSHWLGYVAVDDVDAAVAAAREAGGAVQLEPTDIPSVGRFAILADPAGAVFAPFRGAGGDTPEPERPPGPGEFCWDELLSQDAAACEPFYARVLSWHPTAMTLPADPGRPDMTYHLFKRDAAADAPDRAGMLQMPPDAQAPSHWLPYVAVEDVDAACARAVGLGATVHRPPSDIPAIGRFAVLGDPQGAGFAVYRPADPG